MPVKASELYSPSPSPFPLNPEQSGFRLPNVFRWFGRGGGGASVASLGNTFIARSHVRSGFPIGSSNAEEVKDGADFAEITEEAKEAEEEEVKEEEMTELIDEKFDKLTVDLDKLSQSFLELNKDITLDEEETIEDLQAFERELRTLFELQFPEMNNLYNDMSIPELLLGDEPSTI